MRRMFMVCLVHTKRQVQDNKQHTFIMPPDAFFYSLQQANWFFVCYLLLDLKKDDPPFEKCIPLKRNHIRIFMLENLIIMWSQFVGSPFVMIIIEFYCINRSHQLLLTFIDHSDLSQCVVLGVFFFQCDTFDQSNSLLNSASMSLKNMNDVMLLGFLICNIVWAFVASSCCK